MFRLHAALLALFLGLGSPAFLAQAPLPNRPESLKFAVIGDNGTGKTPQYDVARQMTTFRGAFVFGFVLMMGDNIYGRDSPSDRVDKFERPYGPLLQAGVTFHAALGNHDAPDSRFYAPFNMNGERYYTFARGNVRFFVLDTNSLDAPQLEWLEAALARAREDWRICVFHHPLYSSAGRHGSNVEIRVALEPILVRHGVDVAFSGHDHVYERITPQKGIHYFVVGASGQLRKGDVRPSSQTAAAFDRDQSFLLAEVDGAELYFQAISRTGVTVDSGVIHHQRRAGETTNGS